EAYVKRDVALGRDVGAAGVGVDGDKGERPFAPGGADTQCGRGVSGGVVRGGEEVGGGLGVRLGDGRDAVGGEGAAQRRVVLDDAVVDDGEAPVGGGVRVRVDVRRAAVRRPAGVADRGGRRRRGVLLEGGPQVGELAGALAPR